MTQTKTFHKKWSLSDQLVLVWMVSKIADFRKIDNIENGLVKIV